jgi:hypothetical protein
VGKQSADPFASDGAVVADTFRYAQVGVGDPSVNVYYRVLEERRLWPSVTVLADLKVPIASVERGFGTGAWDAGFGLSISKGIGAFMVFATGEYWILGDMPGLSLNNTFAYSVSIGRPLVAMRLAGMLSVTGSTAFIDGSTPPASLGVGLTGFSGRGHGVMVTANVGLTRSSPDLGVSVGWNVPLN